MVDAAHAPPDDAVEREAALDPARSFIVQAPAGSGKTELLIQRYLRLLATVEEPEQVVAITFTRKAAAEMRRRVQQALRTAAAGENAASAHGAATLALARAVIERDRMREWSLATQPQRLRVDTLDAFNVWLAQQLPVLAGGVAAARIVDDARDYYREAAARTVAALSEPGAVAAALQTLLRALHNDFDGLERMLAALLPKRDQWLHELASADPARLRTTLELALQRLVDDELDALAREWPTALTPELVATLRHAAQFVPDLERLLALAPWLELDALPRAGHAALSAWQGAARLLLTKEGAWRARVTKREGFGPEHRAALDRARTLLERLHPQDGLRARLDAVARLPDPHYDARQWQQIGALQIVLLRLAAELKVLFAERRCVDFPELALAAQRALGQVDEPSELLLALDRRLQHLLVDEFQDTSQSQLKLLELLTSGWEQGDGRTLFLVGDPMQSIYRFRDADMSLFLRAKQRGVGNVRLESLTLKRNFRSAPQIVDWVNGVFKQVFPREDQMATGTAGFRASTAARAAASTGLVQTYAVRGGEERREIATVVEILGAELERDSEQSIAVLVQGRAHLAGLRERLHANGWPAHAVEIDELRDLQLAQDLLGLTRALVHLADRVAWLAVLRAPWCGLEWTDLHALCDRARDRTIWELLHDAERLARLGAASRTRALRTRAALAAAFAARGATSLARWVEHAWRRLDGPACLDGPQDLGVAEQFFALLARSEARGDVEDPATLDALLERAPPQGDPPRGRGIEIMTMHRAKGLEFDTVVLLGLDRPPGGDDNQALYWLRRVAANGNEDLLLAPLAADGERDRLGTFVHKADQERNRAERARLLYVATTRARDRLHVVCHLKASQAEPANDTLLTHLWPLLEPQFAALPPPDDAPNGANANGWQPVLRRLTPASGEEPGLLEDAHAAARGAGTLRPEFAWAGQASVHVGTVVHRFLQQIADRGLEHWSPDVVRAHIPAFRGELELLGVDRAELPAAAERVASALIAALEDPHGRWVLTRHEDARSELRVTVRSELGLEHLRLDRTFVADGRRWIVDFKTGEHEGGDLEAFLTSEVERYRPQLERYARAIAVFDARPIEIALYFPLLKALRSWAAPSSL
jgi:ATP-dependent exoDNAse (exonuclease V) beta subunit